MCRMKEKLHIYNLSTLKNAAGEGGERRKKSYFEGKKSYFESSECYLDKQPNSDFSSEGDTLGTELGREEKGG